MICRSVRYVDVQPGDVVFEKFGFPHEVESSEQAGDVRLNCKGGVHLQGAPGAIIGIIYRPWPEGETESDMARELSTKITMIFRCETWTDSRSLAELREALDTYELGKPLKQPRNESLVDRHMTP